MNRQFTMRTRNIWEIFRRCPRSAFRQTEPIYLQDGHIMTGRFTLLSHCQYFARRLASTEASNPSDPYILTERNISLKTGQQKMKLRKKPISPPDARVANVAIIGAPNAGKSTLANKLLGWRVAAVSEKVHTTRVKMSGILTEGKTQVVFLDTPGMITSPKIKRHSLERSLLTDPHSTLSEAEIILVVVDVSTPWGSTRLDTEVLKALHLHKDKTTVLILNKVDKMKVKKYLLQATRQLTNGVVGGEQFSFKEKEIRKEIDVDTLLHQHKDLCNSDKDTLSKDKSPDLETPLNCNDLKKLDLKNKADWEKYHSVLRHIDKKIREENLKGWSHFDRVFMIIAKDGDGVWDLKKYLLDMAKPGEWRYDPSLITTQLPLEIARQCVWEKCMDHLPDEIPYKLHVSNTMFEVDDNGYLRAVFTIWCNRSRDLKNIVGKDGNNIRKIASEAKQALLDTFRQDMSLKLYAKIRNTK